MHVSSNIKTKISWLHLSDLHFRKSQRWSQDVVLNSLLEDIRGRHSGTNAPDLIFITGDIAYSGQAEEYVLAEEFIRKLQDATEIDGQRLFLVPGNHDDDREREEDALFGDHQRLSDPLQVDRFLGSDQRRRTLFKRQKAYRAFANRICPPDNGGYTDCSAVTTFASLSQQQLRLVISSVPCLPASSFGSRIG